MVHADDATLLTTCNSVHTTAIDNVHSFAIPVVVSAVLVFAVVMAVMDVVGSLQVYFTVNARKKAPLGERSIVTDVMDLKHAMLFIMQKCNYKWHIVKAFFNVLRLRFYSTPVRTDDVANFLVNTALAIYSTFTVPEDGDGVVGVFEMKGFAFPMIEGKLDNTIAVTYFVPGKCKKAAAESSKKGHIHNYLSGCEVRAFVFNGEQIDSSSEQIIILSLMFSTVVHPMLHAFWPLVYQHRNDPELSQYPELFLHGGYMNELATDFPGDCLRVKRSWMAEMLVFNTKLPLPFHAHSLLGIRPYSRVVSFLFKGRVALQRAMIKHKVNIDVEALFLTTIVHATDHLMLSSCLYDHKLDSTLFPDACMNLMTPISYTPCQYFFSNQVRYKVAKQPFYRDLYDSLETIDRVLADNVTLSISF